MLHAENWLGSCMGRPYMNHANFLHAASWAPGYRLSKVRVATDTSACYGKSLLRKQSIDRV